MIIIKRANYANGNMGFEVETMLFGLISNNPGKLNIHKWGLTASALEAACLKHCPKKWAAALPHLERAGKYPSDIWDLVLCTDMTVNYCGWIIAVDVTYNIPDVDKKRSSHNHIQRCLLNLGVDRDIILVVSPENPPTYPRLVAAIKAATKTQEFLSVQIP